MLNAAVAEPFPTERRIGTTWNAAMVERLRQLIEEKHSGAECAATLNAEFGTNFSRNAIMGKAHRLQLGLLSQPKNTLKNVQRRFAPVEIARIGKRKEPKLEVIIPDVCDLDIPLEQRRTILSVAYGECRWPIGDVGDPDFFFCGGGCDDGHSYCPHHFRIGTRPRHVAGY